MAGPTRQLATLLAPVAAEEEADDLETDAPRCGVMPAAMNVAVDGTSAALYLLQASEYAFLFFHNIPMIMTTS